MKRTNRKLSNDTKHKISSRLKGKQKSAEHKKAISKSMECYWATIPYSSEENNSTNLKSDEK